MSRSCFRVWRFSVFHIVLEWLKIKKMWKMIGILLFSILVQKVWQHMLSKYGRKDLSIDHEAFIAFYYYFYSSSRKQKRQQARNVIYVYTFTLKLHSKITTLDNYFPRTFVSRTNSNGEQLFSIKRTEF